MKKKQLKKLKQEVKGITLIALVVTIIVLLILASVAISLTIGQNGIFTRAQEASRKYGEASTNEQKSMEEAANELKGYVEENGDNSGGGSSEDNKLASITGQEKDNTTTTDSLNNKIIVPAGFKVVNPNANVSEGIIIEDVSATDSISKGNQFVWIPVGDINTGTETKKIILGRYDFNNGKNELIQTGEEYAKETPIGTSKSLYVEKIMTDSGNTSARDLKSFCENTIINGGFYIARYEAGVADSNRVVSKQNQDIYIGKKQQELASLVRNMYSETKFYTDMINSFAWDTTIIFIQTFGNKANSKNYAQENGICEGTDNLKSGTSILKSTKELDEQCGIFDLAGNAFEYTTETFTYKNENTYYAPCVLRGGMAINSNLAYCRL